MFWLTLYLQRLERCLIWSVMNFKNSIIIIATIIAIVVVAFQKLLSLKFCLICLLRNQPVTSKRHQTP